MTHSFPPRRASDLPGLLAQAEAAREAGQLTGDDKAALPLYQRILALQPENTGALEGREDALGELLQQARAQLRAGDLAEATAAIAAARRFRSEEHTSELQSLMRISYAVFCLQKKKTHAHTNATHTKT